MAVSGFCGAGGTDEGVRRCGGASVGFDAVHQPHFVARFRALRGSHFGLHVERGRRFETNFPVHYLGRRVATRGRVEGRTCLGPRRRWLRIDSYGRAVRDPCCDRNL